MATRRMMDAGVHGYRVLLVQVATPGVEHVSPSGVGTWAPRPTRLSPASTITAREDTSANCIMTGKMVLRRMLPNSSR